ncbi:unnamed protein product, partial [Polarella glacialis]
MQDLYNIANAEIAVGCSGEKALAAPMPLASKAVHQPMAAICGEVEAGTGHLQRLREAVMQRLDGESQAARESLHEDRRCRLERQEGMLELLEHLLRGGTHARKLREPSQAPERQRQQRQLQLLEEQQDLLRWQQ